MTHKEPTVGRERVVKALNHEIPDRVPAENIAALFDGTYEFGFY